MPAFGYRPANRLCFYSFIGCKMQRSITAVQVCEASKAK